MLKTELSAVQKDGDSVWKFEANSFKGECNTGSESSPRSALLIN